MDLSDKLALEMTRQQQLQQNRLGCGGQEGDDDTKIHLVVDSLLSLVKDIVEFGKQCDQLHEAMARRAKDSSSDPAAETIESLTFEVFAAVVRLAVSVENATTNKTMLAQTARLLRTVRLARITRLAAMATQQLPEL